MDKSLSQIHKYKRCRFQRTLKSSIIKIPPRIVRNNRLLVHLGREKWWDERRPCVKGPGLLLKAKTKDCLSNLTEDVKDHNSQRCHPICLTGPKRPHWTYTQSPETTKPFHSAYDLVLSASAVLIFTYLYVDNAKPNVYTYILALAQLQFWKIPVTNFNLIW